jgi:hypothetical protein
MISRGWSRKEAIRTSAVLAALALVIGVAACGGSNLGSANKTVTVNQTAPAPSQGPPAAGDNGGSAGESNEPVPDYQPGSVVSKSRYSTVLTSPDSVSKIGAYYQDVLAKGRWQLRSSSNTPYSASFTAHRANEGVTVSVYPRGSGSGVSISTHPE